MTSFAVPLRSRMRRVWPFWSAPPAPALPIAYRLALLYLTLPLALWLLGWFRWWVGLPATALLAWALGPVVAGSWRARPRPAAWGLMAVAWIWIMLSPAGGLFAGLDWTKHYALLLDLGRYPWPAFLPDPLAVHVPGHAPPPPLLRYNLGWYVVPGLAARLWGAGALQWAVPLWTWAGVALALLLFVPRGRGWQAALAAAILIFFGDLEYLYARLAAWWQLPASNVVHTPFPMRALLWDPQHFLPTALYALLLWRLRRQPRFLAVSGVLLAAAPFWTALGAVGLLPLAAALVWINGVRPFLRWPNLVLAGPLAGIVLLYLAADAGDIFRSWLWERYDGRLLARWLPVFYLTDFLPWALLLLGARRAWSREPFFWASLATLSLLPFYIVGRLNDLAVRGTEPALMLLACFCADTLTAAARDGSPARRWARAGLIAALALGAATAALDLARGLRTVHVFRYAASSLTILVDQPSAWRHRQYVAFARRPLLNALLRAPEPAPGPVPAAGAPLVRGAVDVHWDGRSLIYVQVPCTRAEAFLQAMPALDAHFGSAFYLLGLGASGYGTHAGYAGYGLRTDAACGWRWIRPALAFDVAAFRTGQAGRWEAELAFNAEGSLALAAYRDSQALQATYQTLTAEPPIASAAFDVHLAPDALALTRDGCVDEDLAARFFLHVAPFEIAALSPARRAYGFDGRNFDFAEVGARGDGRCWAVLPLPAYGIQTLRVGQFASAGELWRADVPFAAHVPAALADLRAAYRATASRTPAARAVFDVHVSAQDVTFVKTPCRQEDVAAKFILHTVPADPRDLPAARRRVGFVNLDFPLEGHGARFDGACLARRALPAYPLDRLRVGQFLSREQRTLWQEEIPVRVAAWRAAYPALVAEPPLVRADFDVYRRARDLIFVKEACRPEDEHSRFILHAFPTRRWRLSPERWFFGFDNRSVSFATHGVRFDDVCLVQVPLPPRDWDRLRVGQLDLRTQRVLWQVEIPLDARAGSKE